MIKTAAAKLVNFFSGGLGSSIVDTVKEYYPPSMSESEKEQLNFQIQRAADRKELEAMKLANEQEAEFNRRIAEMEGTANDLKSIPVLGSLILFLRGVQRPTWGFCTLYIDLKWYTGKLGLLTEYQELSLLLINLLVLGFLFGERALKNLAPVIERIIKARFGDAK